MKRSAQLIIPGHYGDPHKQAAERPYDPAGQPAPVNPMPRLASPNIIRASDGRLIRRGTVVGGSSTFSGVSGTSAQSVAQSPLFYDYRWSTPDKFYFPRNRVVANSIWREIYKRDALVAAATDVFAELPWSKFDLVGMEDSGIRKVYEDMFNALNILPKLPGFARDFLITGELILHTLFDSTKGFWNRVIPHNPDYIRAEGIGLIMDQPLLWLRPTPEIRRLLTSPDPRVRKLQKLLPKELLSSFRMNREVPLDALNTTFIPRLNNSTDIRGTSIYTRLFRIVMYEDFLVNASLAVAQRNAVPLRLFKLGDPNTGWLPSEEDEAALAEMLSMAEADPLAAIIMHHNVQVELVGVSDRALLVSKEWDFIERVKLVALGMAKSFLLGESSFACFEEGTPVLLKDGTPASIETIKVGDLVLNQQGKISKVINNWCEGTPEELLEIEVWGGHKFRVTPNHKFPAWMWPTECICGCGEKIKHSGRAFSKHAHAAKFGCKYNYHSAACPAMVHCGRHRITSLPVGYNPNRVVQAQELRKGDFLKVPKTYDSVINTYVNNDMARLLGYYLAEGSISYGSTNGKRTQPCEMRLTFGIHELDTWGKEVKEICERLEIRCEIAHWKCHGKTRNAFTARVIPKDKNFLRWIILHAGQYSNEKQLSEEVMQWPGYLLEEVLRGYIRGDGTRKDFPSPRQKLRGCKTLAIVQIGTTSKKLATQIALLLFRLGFPVGHVIVSKESPNHNYHILRIQGKAAKDLCKIMWNEELKADVHRCSVWQDSEYMYLPVHAVHAIQNSKPVYNLEVEDSHTYLICDGIATCNSAVAGLQTLLERLSSLRGRLEHDWIMKKLCEPLAKMHGFYRRTQSELDNRIRVKRSEEETPLVPELKWRKSLEPTQDASILGVWRDLKERGILSDRTYASGAGLDIKVERDNKKEEQQFIRDNPEMFGMLPAPETGGGGGGAGGGGGGMGGLPKGGPAEKPPPPEMPGLPAPPALPGGSYHKKTGNRNPYKKYDEIVDELEERANKNGMIDVRDAIEIVSNAKEESEEESLEGVPLGIIQPAGKNLLSGE